MSKSLESPLRWILENWSNPVYRNAYILTLNKLVTLGAGFLFWLLAARVTSAGDLGLASTAVNVILLITLISRFGLDMSLLERLPQQSREDSYQTFTVALAVTGLVALVTSTTYVAGSELWTPDLANFATDWKGYILFCGIGTIWTTHFIVDSFFISQAKGGVVLLKNTVHSIVRVAIVSLLALPFGVSGILLSWGIGLLVALILTFSILIPRVEPNIEYSLSQPFKVIKSLSASSVANQATNLTLVLPVALGSIIILETLGPEQAGLFYILWMIGSVAMIGAIEFSKTSLVELSTSEDIGIIWNINTITISVISAAIMLVGAVVFLPLFGPPYSLLGFIPLIPFALTAIPGILLHGKLSHFRATGRYVELIVVSVAVVGLFLGSLLTGIFPVEKIGWLWLGAVSVGGILGVLLDTIRGSGG